MPRNRALLAVSALAAAIAVAAWLVGREPGPQETPAPVPEEMTLRIGSTDGDLDLYHAIVLRNPSPGREARGVISLTLPSPVNLEAYLDGQRVAAEITGAAAGTAHATVSVAVREQKAVLELAYRVPPEHSQLSWEIPWPLRRLQVDIAPDAGRSLRAARLDGRPLELTEPARLTAGPVRAGAVLEVELNPASEGSRAPALTVTRLIDAWDAAARAVVGDRWQEYAMISLRVSRLSEYAVLLEHVWGDTQCRLVRLEGSAGKESGEVSSLAISGSPGRPFTDDELTFLRPYLETFVALTSPGLSQEERAQVMQRLVLDGDAAAVKEQMDQIRKASGRTANKVTIGNVDYLVTLEGADEGPPGETVRLEAQFTGR